MFSSAFVSYCSYVTRSEEHTSELQSQSNLVCRLLLEKKKQALVHCLPGCAHDPHRQQHPTSRADPTLPRPAIVLDPHATRTRTLHRPALHSRETARDG